MYLKNKYIFEGRFGLERETMRVTSDGKMSASPHPFGESPYLDRDFCENQLELITPACDDIPSLMEAIQRLDSYSRKVLLSSDEYMWLCSNPPHIDSEDDIHIANFIGEKRYKREYRENLRKRYGKRLMLYSGIHFNFSFSERFLRSVCGSDADHKEFTNTLYFRLSKQVFRYSWLIVMLTAASPVYDLSLEKDGACGSGFDGFSSRRCGDKGYWNKFVPILDYTDLHTYVKSVNDYINNGTLFSAGELYLPVRLKPHGPNTLESLTENGVEHIELRMFDVNPLSPLGIFDTDLEFAHYFLLYLTNLPDFVFSPDLQETAVKNHKAAARYDLSEMKINGYDARDAALGILDDMCEYFGDFPNVLENIELQKSKIKENRRYCVEIYNRFKDDFQEKMLELSKTRR